MRLKAMALRSNVHELPAIAAFCRAAYDATTSASTRCCTCATTAIRSATRRSAAERLSPAEIVAVEQADEERAGALEKGCDKLIVPEYDGDVVRPPVPLRGGQPELRRQLRRHFRLCADLWHPDCSTTCARAAWRRPGTSWCPACARCAQQIRSSWSAAGAARSSTCACGARPTPTWRAARWMGGANIFARWPMRGRR